MEIMKEQHYQIFQRAKENSQKLVTKNEIEKESENFMHYIRLKSEYIQNGVVPDEEDDEPSPFLALEKLDPDNIKSAVDFVKIFAAMRAVKAKLRR